MATIDAQHIITRGLRMLGVIGAGQSISAEDNEAGLESLNDMLDGWNTEGLIVYEVRDEIFSLASGSASVTIGSSGNFNTDRPVNIEYIFIREDGTDYRLSRLTSHQWAGLYAKSTDSAGWPAAYYYQNTFPLGTLYFVPVPSQTFATVHVGTWRQFSDFVSASASATFPSGFKEAMITNLALTMAPEYGIAAPNEVVRMAIDSLARIKRLRNGPLVAKHEVALLTARGGFGTNIITG